MIENIAFSRIEECNLTVRHDLAIAALIKAIYPVDFGGRSFMHQRHHFRLLAHQEAELVGHVAVLFRAVRLGDALIDVMGLAEVATARSHRKRGIASKLVDMAVSAAKQSTAEFVLLFGTEKIYRSAGFVPVNNPVRAVRLPENRSGDARDCGPQPLMVLQTGSTEWDPIAPVDLVGSIF